MRIVVPRRRGRACRSKRRVGGGGHDALPTTKKASFVPPEVFRERDRLFSGGSREPETIAAIVSSRWCLVFSSTAGGSGRRSAPAMYGAQGFHYRRNLRSGFQVFLLALFRPSLFYAIK